MTGKQGSKCYVSPLHLLQLQQGIGQITQQLAALAAWGPVEGQGFEADLEHICKPMLVTIAKIERDMGFTVPQANMIVSTWDKYIAEARERIKLNRRPVEIAAAEEGQLRSPEELAADAIAEAKATAGWPEKVEAVYQGIDSSVAYEAHTILVQGEHAEAHLIRFAIGTHYDELVNVIYQAAVGRAVEDEQILAERAKQEQAVELPADGSDDDRELNLDFKAALADEAAGKPEIDSSSETPNA